MAGISPHVKRHLHGLITVTAVASVACDIISIGGEASATPLRREIELSPNVRHSRKARSMFSDLAGMGHAHYA
jgi:hypothetical protein